MLQPTLIFDDFRVVSVTAGRTKYRHTFGGEIPFSVVQPQERDNFKLHLLSHIDMNDPLVPLKRGKTTMWGTSMLPLLYCFDFRVNVLGYQCREDGDIDCFFDDEDPHVSEDEGFPFDDFPAIFKQSSMKLKKFSYHAGKLKDALQFAAVFGLNKLSISDYKKALDEQSEFYEMLMGEQPETVEELLSFFASPFPQGRPNTDCLNPSCAEFGSHRRMKPFCIVPAEPVSGMQLWGTSAGEVQVIFEICEECETIHSSNQCT